MASKLFPTIRKDVEVKVDFSDIQLKKYIDVRRDERGKESRFNIVSTINYRRRYIRR